MNQDTKNKMEQILKAAQEKASQKAQPNFAPAPQQPAPQPKEESKPTPIMPAIDRPDRDNTNDAAIELSTLTIDDLLNDYKSEDQPIYCTPMALELPQLKRNAATAVNINVFDYSKWSICVQFDKKPSDAVLNILHSLGGSFNTRLTYNGKKVCGWIFPKRRENDVRKALDL